MDGPFAFGSLDQSTAVKTDVMTYFTALLGGGSNEEVGSRRRLHSSSVLDEHVHLDASLHSRYFAHQPLPGYILVRLTLIYQAILESVRLPPKWI